MSFLFGGKPPTTAELSGRYRTNINRSIRELDREVLQLDHQVKVLMSEIRRCAETNPMMAYQKAQAVVRTRKMSARSSAMKSQLQEISSRILNVRSIETLETAVASANRAMRNFNTRLGSRTLASTLHEFERENTQMGVQNELADEMLDGAFEDEDRDSVDDIVGQVLREAGVTLPLSVAPREEVPLEVRLERLKIYNQRARE